MGAAAYGRISFVVSLICAMPFAQLLAPTFASGAEVLPLPRIADRADAFSGIDMTMDSIFAWAGATYAARGRLDEDGLRLRMAGGTGFYRYRNAALPGGENRAMVFSGEFLAGYRHRFGPIIASVYGGVHAEQQTLRMPDPSNPTAGGETGIKLAGEIYSHLLSQYVVNAFATISSVHGKYNMRASISRAFEFPLSHGIWALGIEAGALGDRRASEIRLGLAAAMTWQRRILAFAGGITDRSDKGRGAYATLSIYAPF
jgi:hypothetical protein